MEMIFEAGPISIDLFKRTKYFYCEECKAKPVQLYTLNSGGGYEYEAPNLCKECLVKLVEELYKFTSQL